MFDVGQVLFRWEPRRLYAELIPDEAALDRFLGEVVTPEWHFQHDAGRPLGETAAELCARYPEHAALIGLWGPRFLDTLPGPVPGMPEIVEALDDAGVSLFIISNFSAELWPAFRAREAALLDRFRATIVSGEERLVKPDPAIYRLALDRFALAPGTALFVDDRADNVAAAEIAGFVGHHFRDAAILRGTLTEQGLLA